MKSTVRLFYVMDYLEDRKYLTSRYDPHIHEILDEWEALVSDDNILDIFEVKNEDKL